METHTLEAQQSPERGRCVHKANHRVSGLDWMRTIRKVVAFALLCLCGCAETQQVACPPRGPDAFWHGYKPTAWQTFPAGGERQSPCYNSFVEAPAERLVPMSASNAIDGSTTARQTAYQVAMPARQPRRSDVEASSGQAPTSHDDGREQTIVQLGAVDASSDTSRTRAGHVFPSAYPKHTVADPTAGANVEVSSGNSEPVIARGARGQFASKPFANPNRREHAEQDPLHKQRGLTGQNPIRGNSMANTRMAVSPPQTAPRRSPIQRLEEDSHAAGDKESQNPLPLRPVASTTANTPSGVSRNPLAGLELPGASLAEPEDSWPENRSLRGRPSSRLAPKKETKNSAPAGFNRYPADSSFWPEADGDDPFDAIVPDEFIDDVGDPGVGDSK